MLQKKILYLKNSVALAVTRFFRIEEAYRFEWNDLRAFATLINVILVMIFGLSISWLGLFIAVVGLVKDLTSDRHINGIVMHLSSAMLNIFFIIMYYKGM